MRLSQKWTNGLKEEAAKKDIRSRVEECQDVLQRLDKMIDTELKEKIKASEANDNFDSPAWAESQAYNLGQRAALRAIKAWLPKSK